MVGIKGFLVHKFVKVIKSALSPCSETVRHFNTLADVKALKNHLGSSLKCISSLPSRDLDSPEGLGWGPGV